jgi:hypothetical protein
MRHDCQLVVVSDLLKMADRWTSGGQRWRQGDATAGSPVVPLPPERTPLN